jgi:cytochrome c
MPRHKGNRLSKATRDLQQADAARPTQNGTDMMSAWATLRLVAGLVAGLVLMAMKPVAASDDGALRGHGGPVKSVAVSADGTAALTGSFDYSAILWKLSGRKNEVAQRFDDNDGAVNSVQFVPGTSRAVTASDDGMVSLWDLETGERVHRFEGHSQKVVNVAVSADGSWAASAAWDGTVRLWNLITLEPGPVLEGHRGTVNAVVYSPDGRLVYSAGYNGELRKWDAATGELLRIVYSHGWGINVLADPGDGRHLVFGALDGSVGLVDLGGDGQMRLLQKFERPVLSLTSLTDAGLVAAGSGNGHINVWDTSTWRQKYAHQFTQGPVWTLAFADGGNALYFGGLDDHVAYWQMNPDKPFEVAQSQVPRRFQKDEGLGPGERQFARKCSICHSLGEDHANRAGPSLIGVFGRKAGTVAGYAYSRTLKEADFVWSAETIDRLFAEGPEYFVPGSKMPLQKMSKPEERLALIEFLKRATQVAPQQKSSQSGG